MTVIIHDGDEAFEQKLQSVLGSESESLHYISDNGSIHHCVGCFGCWVKTPGQCVIRDAYGDMGKLLGNSNRVIVISKMTYGGYSPFVKNVFDRSISYINPDFVQCHGEMHHKRRYTNNIDFGIYFYGPALDSERKLAERLATAIGKNLASDQKQITFCANLEEVLKEVHI